MSIRAPAGLGLLFALAVALSARADPPIWRAHGANGSEIVMFGSVHLLDEGAHWFGPALADALKGADRVWFEVPLDAQAQAQAQALAVSKGRLPAGETLPALLSPEGRMRLKATAAQLGVPEAALQPLQPWLAEALLSVAYFIKAGARTDLGVEHEIERAAPPTAQRGAMETVADQIDALSGASRPDQIASLEQALKDIHDEPDSFKRLVHDWETGDTAGLVREELEPMRRESPSVFKRLVTDRNRRWVAELEALLKTGRGRTLVVVGVGHLVGEGKRPGAPARRRGQGRGALRPRPGLRRRPAKGRTALRRRTTAARARRR